jgi:phenol 2-monooxygenase
VLEGRSPETLLATYSAERQVIAQNLIDFDKQWSSLMAAKPEDLPDPTTLEDFYVRTAEFPAGFMTQYAPSIVVAEPVHQDLATGFPIGKRFKSAMVSRVSDGNPLHLGHQARADGRWRIYVFADEGDRVDALATWLAESPESPLASTPDGLDRDAWFDVKVIYPRPHTEVDIIAVPEVFKPRVGPFGLADWEKVYGTAPDEDIFAARGISADGAVVVVRPDHYVADVLPLDGTEELAAFFAGLSRALSR